MTQPLQQQIALVTGGGAGIGQSIASKLANMGATVIVTDMRLEAAQNTVAQLAPQAPGHSARKLDVTDKDEIISVFADVVQQYGGIDILINNAGVSTMNAIEHLTVKEWEYQGRFSVHPGGNSVHAEQESR
jgi:NAD(P)-dependent dehydrogenase (short-subunit alcohol dehydrogenase family)